MVQSADVNTGPATWVSATDLGIRLKRFGLLESRLDRLGLGNQEGHRNLLALFDSRAHYNIEGVSQHDLELLTKCRLLRHHGAETPARRPVPALPFVFAVNIELTYDCNYRCSHCLQNGFRQTRAGQWIDTAMATRAIEQAWFAGLLRAGLNLTGGEPVQARSNLAALLDAARLYGVPVRVNTNGWWGEARTIRVGDQEFRSAPELIRWLVDNGTHVLALSMDSRYVKDGVPWQPVARIIEICKSEGLKYETVETGGVTWQEIDRLRTVSKVHNPVVPLLPKRPVDIGCSWSDDNTEASQSFDSHPPPCGWEGFFAPTVLHVEPGGGVRTCMYAPGSSFVGNLHQEDLLSIINRFNSHPVTRLFRDGWVPEFVTRFIDPYVSSYRPIAHPCANAAVVSRVAEEVLPRRVTEAGRASSIPTAQRLREIHERIASEYRLSPLSYAGE